MPTTNMALDLPTENGDAGVWDTKVNAALTLVDSHDHTTGKGKKVPAAGLDINADLSYSSGGAYYAITNAKALDMQPQAVGSVTGYSGAIFVNSADNELYFRNSGGTNVKITSGATINVAAVAGIGGDYGTVAAECNFVDASDAYTFKQQTGGGVKQYARLWCGGIDLYEFKANPTAGVPTARVRIESPAALAASYTVTMPTAAAAAGIASLLYVSSTGVASFSQAVTATNGTFTGALNVTGTFASTGNANVGGHLSVSTNGNVTVSGTGDFKHGDKTLVLVPGDVSLTAFTRNGFMGVTSTTGGAVVNSLPLRIGDRVKTITARCAGDGAVDGTVFFAVARDGSTVHTTSLSLTNVPAGYASYATASALYTIAATDTPYIEIDAFAAGLTVQSISVVYDRP
jgi:hypothetical protein